MTESARKEAIWAITQAICILLGEFPIGLDKANLENKDS